MPQFVALADAFSHSREDGDPLVQSHDGLHELHDQDGLAHSGPAEQACFATPDERAEEIDHFDSALQHLGLGGVGHESHRMSVNVLEILLLEHRAAVQGFSEQVEHSSQTGVSHRDHQRGSGV